MTIQALFFPVATWMFEDRNHILPVIRYSPRDCLFHVPSSKRFQFPIPHCFISRRKEAPLLCWRQALNLLLKILCSHVSCTRNFPGACTSPVLLYIENSKTLNPVTLNILRYFHQLIYKTWNFIIGSHTDILWGFRKPSFTKFWFNKWKLYFDSHFSASIITGVEKFVQGADLLL